MKFKSKPVKVEQQLSMSQHDSSGSDLDMPMADQPSFHQADISPLATSIQQTTSASDFIMANKMSPNRKLAKLNN